MGYLNDQVVSLLHDSHVRRDHSFAESPELLVVLGLNDLVVTVLSDTVFVEHARYSEEGTEERIALHPEL